MSVTVLERELYTEAAAARLLGVAQSTLNYWLEGGERRGKTYRPVIRQEPRGSRAAVTWGADIAAGWRAQSEQSPVLIDPNLRFGMPAVEGIRTAIIWEHVQAGEIDEDIADEFEIPLDAVQWAITYERAAHAA